MTKRIELKQIAPNNYEIAIDFGTGDALGSGLILEQKEEKSIVSFIKSGELVEMPKEFYPLDANGQEDLLSDLELYGLAGKHYSINHAISEADPFNYRNEELENAMMRCYDEWIDLGWFFSIDDLAKEVDRLQTEADNAASDLLKSYGVRSPLEGGACYWSNVWCDDDDEPVGF